jgi:hypothetical protein
MSHAQITCLTPLANPRTLNGKTLILDAELYISDQETLSAVFRYFNKDDIDFTSMHLYVLRASVSQILCVFDLKTSN